MGLETGTTIASLNTSWPLGTDPKSQGDDHLRLIKTVFKNDVVPKSTGGEFAGSVSVKTSDNAGLSVDAGSGYAALLALKTSGADRWRMQYSDTDGALSILRYAAGVYQDTPFKIEQGSVYSRNPITVGYDGGATPVNVGGSDGVLVADYGAVHAYIAAGTALAIGRGDNGVVAAFFRGRGTGVGSIAVTASATAYNTSSDYRLKENVTPLIGALSRLALLKPSRFNFIADPDKVTVDGFLAHEAGAVVPECCTGAKDAVDEHGAIVAQGIDQSKLVPLLVAAVQEAVARIEAMEERLGA